METRPTVLTPYLKFDLPYDTGAQQSIIDRLMATVIERWKPYGVTPVYRLSQPKKSRGKITRPALLCIWVYGSPVSLTPGEEYLTFGYANYNEAKHEHLFIHQELEKAQGSANNPPVMSPFLLDPDELDPWTLMLPLTKAEYGRVFGADNDTRKQLAQLAPGKHAIIWRSRGRWEGVFELADTGEKILVDYRENGNKHWPIVAGQIFMRTLVPRETVRDKVRYREVFTRSKRVRAIPPLVLFQRTVRSYHHRIM